MNVFLVGPMGSGKSAVGRQLARRLGLGFVDSDDEIETRTKTLVGGRGARKQKAKKKRGGKK